ncbi:uncharacterized protein LOC110920337 [Helianthus annuus]|uniref:uncharacterized protein LOC110920337 n=1 Tax=Helianthus annuus TaxID=4232 RepID=UPI0016534073|nr:uncharacterized protein LOC110920337 [Helianthus annuus]
MSKLNLGPVKAINVMKNCFGGFENVGASKVEFKNYKRQINLFIWEYDAEMVVRHLDEKKSQPNFSYDYFTDEENPLKGLFLVSVRLCNSTNFKERIYGIVWTDILTPEEFESEWEVVIREFNLADNDWLFDIFALRESWILACYIMEELSGLMRTTSRRTASQAPKNDHESRYKRPQLKNNYQVLEGQAADIYTKNIFCDIQAELIRIADCINQRYEDQADGFVKFYINDFQQPCTSLFEVMYRKSDCTCSCSCRRFEKFGLLCRHIFYVLRSLDIREFPKQYILNRWRKEASPNCSSEYSISLEYMTELDPDVQSMMREIIFSTEYTLNRLSGNKEELSLYKDHVQSYMKKVQDIQIVAPPASTKDRFAEITGQYKNDKNPIRVLVGCKSKGSGYRKLLKSKQQVAIEKTKSKSKPGAKERQCHNCKGYGHYASTCKKAVIKRKSTRSSRESEE